MAGFSVDRKTGLNPDNFTYAKATLVAGANSKLSFAKLSFAFTFFKTDVKSNKIR